MTINVQKLRQFRVNYLISSFLPWYYILHRYVAFGDDYGKFMCNDLLQTIMIIVLVVPVAIGGISLIIDTITSFGFSLWVNIPYEARIRVLPHPTSWRRTIFFNFLVVLVIYLADKLGCWILSGA